MAIINDYIKGEALKWRGEKEIPQNQGFENPELEKLIREITGWTTGQAWCAAMAWVIWHNAYMRYHPKWVPFLKEYFSLSAVQSFKNFSKRPALSELIFDISRVPVIGSLIYFQDYRVIEGELKAVWQGHAGIVVDIPEKGTSNILKVQTIEGNSNETGFRNGVEVAENMRIIEYSPKPGLVPLGFVHPLVDEDIEAFLRTI